MPAPEITKLLSGDREGYMLDVVRKLGFYGGPSWGEYDSRCRGGRKTTGCVYRSPEGPRCAAGVSIPDEAYDVKLEGHPVDHPPVYAALGLDEQTFERRDPDDDISVRHVIGALQSAHDQAATAVYSDDVDRPAFVTILAESLVDQEYLWVDKAPSWYDDREGREATYEIRRGLILAAYQQGVNERQMAQDAS